MRTFRLFICLLLLFAPGLSPVLLAQQPSLDDFLSQLQHTLIAKDFQSYGSLFSSEIREREEATISHIFGRFQVEKATFYRSYFKETDTDEARLLLKALFESSHVALLETWDLKVQKKEGRWLVKSKQLLGDISHLYKIRLPAERAERVKSLEVRHFDIHLSFREALLFYDNIPGLETALLVIGEGKVFFSPSLPREKHQLELVYGQARLEDRLEYAYLRFSNSFFETKVKAVPDEDSDRQVTEAEKNQAYSLFNRHYNRSFTVENSLNGELLSFLPQGEEAVFEFKGKKAGMLSYIYSPFAQEEVSLFQWEGEKIISLYSPEDKESKRKMFISFGQKYDIKNYQIDIDCNPEESYLSGKALVEVESEVESLDALKLKINPDLEILRIIDEDKHELFFTKDRLRKVLYIYLYRRPSRGWTASVEIYYRGKLKPPQVVSDVTFGPQYDDRIVLIPPKYETYLYSRLSYWYPEPSDEDYFTARLKLIIPPRYSAVSNGILAEQSTLVRLEEVENLEKEGKRVYVFQTQKPVKYLSFILGEFIQVAEKSSFVPMDFYCDKEVRNRRKNIVDEAEKILRLYGEWFGPFPYEKLTIVKRLWPASGGHSPASVIILNELPRFSNEGRLVSADSPVNLSRWKEYFLAHEIAHQWWGQGLAWASYHDQWLSEGMAQFSSILYLKEKYGEGTYADILKKISKWVGKKSFWGAITMGSRISYLDFDAFQSTVYNKSALVLNMLKDLLGDELFFRGLGEFFKQHRYRAATTEDFMASMENTTGRNLDPFFRPWFYSFQLPEVNLSWAVEKKEAGYRTKLKVVQPKGLFVFPLWLEWTEGRNRVRQMVVVESKNQEFVFEAQGKPRGMKVNPEKAVPGQFH